MTFGLEALKGRSLVNARSMMAVDRLDCDDDLWLCSQALKRLYPSGIIPKPGKDPTCSDNYRPIALAPTLSNILEWCILLIYGDSFSTSPLQFGFKPGMSADMSTGLIKNAGHQSLLFLMALMCLDASLMPRRHSIESVTSSYLASYLRKISHQLLLDCFSPGIGIKNPQFSGIKHFSENFSVSNGVKQGGVLSPILFILMN